MDLISLSAVNAKSPYKIGSDQSGSFSFVTDKQQLYHVAFIEDKLFYEHGIYQYCLETEMHTGADSHVYEVVVALIEEFFKSSAKGLLYVCDSEDRRQAARNRLFNRWFNSYAEKDKYLLLQREVQYEDMLQYVSLIVRKDHPEVQSITDAFDRVLSNIEEYAYK